MKQYYVALEVVYPTIVEAESEEEAIEIAMGNCPYDNDGEPYVVEMESDEE